MSDLNRLFQENPLNLTRDDILTVMVPEFRRQRANFNLGAEAPSKAKAKPAAKPGATIDLAALGLVRK